MSEFHSDSKIVDIEQHLQKLYILINKFRWLIDIYISDFFTEKLCERVNKSWWATLTSLKSEELLSLLSDGQWKSSKVWPLGLLAYRRAIHSLSLKRYIPESVKFKDGQYLNLNQIFRKHVKPKKQHEIHSAAKLINDISQNVGSNSLIDFGGGQGHLSRLLSYQYGLNAITIDACSDHQVKNEIFDREIERVLRNDVNVQRCHVIETIQTDTIPNQFIDKINQTTINQKDKNHQLLKNLDQNEQLDKKFTFITLHGCGNLIPTILRLYSNCTSAVGLVNVSCCYMKMDELTSFPLSSFLRSKSDSNLSWEAKELACHFIDSYMEKLMENHPNLKSHCYRAAMQEVLKEKDETFCNSTIKLKVKNIYEMNFTTYAEKVLEKLKFSPGLTEYQEERSKERLLKWFDVVVLYVLRLAIAPVIESVILLDRLLFLKEQGFKSYIQPIFDPSVSPRNFALISEKI
ncbi:DgyrCDS9062 [Dimorphilus gyrociliatus]|uniref:DgyrCDS9062 n=1 Tax=Dimorphilus gyrociliatus TaxID=2664684 RepID=A0A7I8W173_9ANNE|nr:DgyrCDS9062 [Dimorphilus gyrociliatus]